MRYIVELMGGRKVFITEQEFGNLAGKSGLLFVPSIGEIINLSSVTAIYPESAATEEADHKLGVLHDGTRVIRQFGEWMCINDNKDEDGHYVTRPSLDFYPEVRMDCVPSVQTYEAKFAMLPLEERKALMLEGKDLARYDRQGGFSRIDGSTTTLLDNE